MSDAAKAANRGAPPQLKLGPWRFRLPRSRWLRVLIGVLFVVFGCLGFLPILGFWMIPVGLIVLSHDFASVRRQRRRFAVWWGRRRQAREAARRARLSA